MNRRASLCLAALMLPCVACDEDTSPAETVCEPGPGVICTYAGNGQSRLGGEGRDALHTPLYLPQDLTFGPDGAPYIIDFNNHRIRTVVDGKVFSIIGSGDLGDAKNGNALQTALNHPTHIAFDANGTMFVAAWHNSKVLQYLPGAEIADGEVEVVCGTGGRGFNGYVLDGSGQPVVVDEHKVERTDLPAASAVLDLPVALAFTPQGEMYIADQANQRIRKVGSDGIIRTWAGTGTAGFSGDGGPATAAQISLPTGQAAAPAGRIALAADGTLYLADTNNHVIRRITADGIISTIAGKPQFPGYSGDLGPAVDAAFDTPVDVEVTADGTLYVADMLNNCIRRIAPDGMISTVAGQCGVPGFEGDAGPATAALLNQPYGIALDASGNLYIADTENQRIRVVYK